MSVDVGKCVKVELSIVLHRFTSGLLAGTSKWKDAGLESSGLGMPSVSPEMEP